ncbi:transcriptional adaptor 2 [Saitoella complicata NRRL Y-17804]|uniref:Transcriptional adapter 2 n=1 Tax=Saitoella complicata (strain BCRC 22490 / CBS 7301 / JCM 7358 / NBRC 10748 / NRRL Y-17804) TaxID=698492 RepID=A0A0E9NHT7_SAICN|nr:transcriptional adaptor 2 [Saitoella complicata NRRL Y-17804]ODQ56023.1 transcriptional adaptor 2 [Saitoella complicata NRRL Y-17804]GAO49368.1 hypothetical protein G7K_3519-t1 [Saitoella complicata NRRL Y-17804]
MPAPWHITCDSCVANLTHTVHIQCVVCPSYDSCVQCWAKGAETGTAAAAATGCEGGNEEVKSPVATGRGHKKDHAYRVIEEHAFPIFDEDWGADEENMLIEGCEQFGLGNWQDVADHIGSRTKEECADHYYKVYLASDTWPLPNMNLQFPHDPKEFRQRKRRRIERLQALSKQPLPPRPKPMASVPAMHEIQGYMPARLDFEHEFENEAEMSIKDMQFEDKLETEAPGDVDLKLATLEIYNARLTRRVERKRAILEHGLLEYKKLQSIEKKKTKEERDVMNKAKVFARLMTKQDHEQFVDGLLAEHNLRRRIAELQEWRRNGLTTVEQGNKYELDKQQRALAIRNPVGLGPADRLASRYTNPRRDSMSMTDATPPPMSYSPSPHLAGIPQPTPIPMHPGMPMSAGKGPRKPPNPLNISTAADYHLLTPSEQTLCSQLRILPKPYLVIKETLFRELLRTGGQLKKRQARELIKIDVNKTARIFDFLVSQNWVKVPGSMSGPPAPGGPPGMSGAGAAPAPAPEAK